LPQNTRYRYELVVEDSGPDPKKARDVIEKTIEHRKVDAVSGAVSLIGQVTKPYVTKERIPHLCLCSVTNIGDGSYNFTNIPSPEDEGRLWVTEAQRRGIKTVALMSQEYPSIDNHVSALKAEAARVGLRIVFEEKFDGATTDFRPMIAKAQASAPDVYFFEAFNPVLDLLAQRLADAKIKNLSSIVAPSVSQRQDLFEGIWYNDSDLVDFSFKKRFEAKYPDT